MSCLLLQVKHILTSYINYFSSHPTYPLTFKLPNLLMGTSDHKKFLLKSMIFKFLTVTFFHISDTKLSPFSSGANLLRVENNTYSRNYSPFMSKSPVQLGNLIGLKLLVPSSGWYPVHSISLNRFKCFIHQLSQLAISRLGLHSWNVK